MYAINDNQELETPQPLAPAANWWAKARCNDGAGTLTFLFFSEDLIDIARAKAICSKCPVRETCLSEALSRQEPFGVWGGQLLHNGRIVTQKRKRGRPPKHPRPEIVVDEVPLPPFIRTA
jgi:WhiB family transcriptional regulator, redox-sensing transcriptional regulator